MSVHQSPIWALIIAIIFSAACANKESVQPSANIRDSFGVQQAPPAANGDLAVDKYLVGIRKSALEKEFLMRTQFVGQTLVPAFQGMRSRIIAFRQHGNELLMLEATQGHVVDNGVPATLLLAKFSIVKEADEILYFDLNQGFTNMYVAGDWYASDSDGREYQEGQVFKAAPFNMSFIEEARFDSLNQLVVSQVGQLRIAAEDGTPMNSAVKAKFYFSVYQPDPAFKKVDLAGDFTQFGYFESNPIITAQGNPAVYATHFSTSQPIVYAVSNATPADFKAAVREGILYWNKAFGREVIKVVDAPAGGDAPSSEMNVVQWVNWDWAGAAYADAQMDPRTGQTMHAQVFMTSVFAVGGKAAARRLIRQISNATTKPASRIGLKGFAGSTTCNRTHEGKFVTTMSSILANPAVTDQDVLRAAQDYVRNVVAHEVGHTLGLRHNFAGSLHANFKPSDHRKILTEYFVNKSIDPALIASSSVMDYDSFADALITGHQILAQPKAMPYDEMSIRHLYDGVAYTRAEVPPFCTDGSIGKVVDCMMWDSGPSTIESVIADGTKAWNELFDTMMRKFVDAKAPAPGLPSVPLERVAFDTKELADTVSSIRPEILKSLETDSKFLSVIRQFDVVDSTNSDLVNTKKADYVKQEIDRLGGLAKVLSPKSPVELQTLLTDVDNKINGGDYDKGVDQSNTPYQFTTAEMGVIRARSKEVIEKIFAMLPEYEQTKLVEWKAALPEHVLSDEYADVLQARVEELLLATTGQTLSGSVTLKDGSAIQVTVPVFKYKHGLRKAAFAMLKREGAPSVDWGYLQREAVRTQVKALIETPFGGKFDEVKAEALSRDLLRWYLENKEVTEGLGE